MGRSSRHTGAKVALGDYGARHPGKTLTVSQIAEGAGMSTHDVATICGRDPRWQRRGVGAHRWVGDNGAAPQRLPVGTLLAVVGYSTDGKTLVQDPDTSMIYTVVL